MSAERLALVLVYANAIYRDPTDPYARICALCEAALHESTLDVERATA